MRDPAAGPYTDHALALGEHLVNCRHGNILFCTLMTLEASLSSQDVFQIARLFYIAIVTIR